LQKCHLLTHSSLILRHFPAFLTTFLTDSAAQEGDETPYVCLQTHIHDKDTHAQPYSQETATRGGEREGKGRENGMYDAEEGERTEVSEWYQGEESQEE
jgi:hypothetical protein